MTDLAMATGYSETFRGDVAPWEVDATEHFTVAYYYEKFEGATWRFLQQLGVDAAAARTTRALTHYKAELRNRDIYRVETALIDAGATPTIAHKLFNAGSGELCTTMQQTLTGVTLSGPAVAWDGDGREDRPIPGDEATWVPALANVARVEEADWAGNLSLPGYIHRFSTANSFIMSAFGMTPEYMTTNRYGLSTFEFQLAFQSQAKPGDLIDIESCIAQLGGSSVRFCHRMRNAATGADIASLSQFGVQLDLEARRPSRIGDDLRARAEALLNT
ncbi:MAG: thioesterase family protein [Alphaproteobacteria bacterium]|jgi:acyl-CoA thioesterase FadM|nr:thioesterase family protein [Alphaproteobacteria bacterium]